MLAACQPAAPAAPTESTEAVEAEVEETSDGLDLRVALVLPGLINDGGFNQTGYEALMAAKENLGVEATYVESVASADGAKFLQDYAEEGYDIIFGYSGGFINSILQVAPEFPDTTFGTIADSNVEFTDNVWVIGHDYMDGFFLTGVLAGMMTETDKPGFVGGQEFKSYVASAMAYEEGAKWANPDAEVFTTFVGDFNDPVASKNIASAQIETGVDIIQSGVDNGVFGLFEAATEAGDVWIIHYVKNLCGQSDVILASMTMAYPEYVQYIIEQVAAGNPGGYTPNSVTQGLNEIIPCTTLPDEVQTKLDEATEKIKSGELDYTHVTEIE
jgi:basic membrane protein A